MQVCKNGSLDLEANGHKHIYKHEFSLGQIILDNYKSFLTKYLRVCVHTHILKSRVSQLSPILHPSCKREQYLYIIM